MGDRERVPLGSEEATGSASLRMLEPTTAVSARRVHECIELRPLAP